MNYSKGVKLSALGLGDQKADLDISWGTKPTVVQPYVGNYADVALLQSFLDAAMSSVKSALTEVFIGSGIGLSG
jgi:hypothetical protein